jgi:hypothetical protein
MDTERTLEMLGSVTYSDESLAPGGRYVVVEHDPTSNPARIET